MSDSDIVKEESSTMSARMLFMCEGKCRAGKRATASPYFNFSISISTAQPAPWYIGGTRAQL